MNEVIKPECALPPLPEHDLMKELRILRVAYVCLLDAFSARVNELGGECSPLDVLVEKDVALRRLRPIIDADITCAAIAADRAQQGEPVARACGLDLAFRPAEKPEVEWGAECGWHPDYEPFPLYRAATKAAAPHTPTALGHMEAALEWVAEGRPNQAAAEIKAAIAALSASTPAVPKGEMK